MATRTYISDHRVGTPNLRPLPLDRVYDSTCAELQARLEAGGWEMKESICGILAACGIDVEYEDEEKCEAVAGLVSRYFPRRPWTGRPTLLVVARWAEESSESWPKAVQQIDQMIKDRLRKCKINVDIEVEIIAAEGVRAKVMAPICDDEKLVSMWPFVSEKIDKILQDSVSTRDHVSAVSLFRMGYSLENPTSNPITVYIATDTTELDNGEWERVQRKIRALLDDWRLYDIKVHIEYNPVDLFAFELVEPVNRPRVAETLSDIQLQIKEPYQRRVHLGTDIGVSLDLNREVDGIHCNPGLGTVGCYIEIKSARRPEWNRYILTCYHVVRPAFDGFRLRPKRDVHVAQGTNSSLVPTVIDVPAPGSELRRVDERGFAPNTRFERALPAVEQPSRTKHNTTVSRLRRVIAKEKDIARQAHDQGLDDVVAAQVRAAADAAVSAVSEKLEKKIAFFDNGEQVVGKLYAGSGFLRRTPSGGALDWALIEIDSARQGTNMLPLSKAWDDLYDVEDLPCAGACNVALRAPAAGPSAAFTDRQKLFKVGARTGSTSGTYSRIKTSFTMAESKYMDTGPTKEHVVIGNLHREDTERRLNPFADTGDSGSIVFDKFGRAVGMVLTGHSPQGCSNQGYACITPIQAILDDIVKFSKGAITDIRIVPPAQGNLGKG